MSTGVTFCNEDYPKFLPRREHQSEAFNIFLAFRKSPGRWLLRGESPFDQELMATLAQLPQ